MYVSPAASVDMDNLISGTRIPIKPIAGLVTLTGGGKITRGTPMQRAAGGNNYSPATTRIDAVLMESAENTGTTGVTFELPVAPSGEFNLNAMNMASLTDNAAAAVAEAVDRQIYIAPQNQAPYLEPDNFTTAGGA
jgi:hypothetical protein